MRLAVRGNADRTPRAGARYVFAFSNGNRRHVFCDGPADPAKFVGPQRLWRVFFDGRPAGSGPALLTDLIPEDHFRTLCIGRVVDAPNVNAKKGKTKMNAVVPFEFEGTAVRVTDKDGGPWFVAADVCKILGIEKYRDATARLDPDERGSVKVDTLGGPQDVTAINESGLYTLILRCRNAVTPGTVPHRFRKWVTAEVLPAIRKTGRYGGLDPMKALDDPAAMRGLLLTYCDKVLALEDKVKTQTPKVEFYDRYANADGLFGLQNAGRILGCGANRFVSWLKRKYVFYQGTHLVPYRRYVEQGLFEVKTAVAGDRPLLQAFVTPKGVQCFARELGLPERGDLFAALDADAQTPAG